MSLRVAAARMLFVCAVLAGALSVAAAESRRSLPAVRATAPPVIDGDLSDACWRAAPKAEGFIDPYLVAPTVDPTEAWICYDATNIYAAFRAYDSQPDKIVAQETKEEASLRGDDVICLNLDPFQTHQTTDRCLFVVNPRGAHSTEIVIGRAVKTESKGEWKSAARIGTNGWTAELAIPWAMLNYPIGSKPVTMGLNFSRMQQRTQVISFWSHLGMRTNYKLDGHWDGVEPPPFKPQFSFLPYVLGQAGERLRGDAGLDVRAVLTPSVTGVLTVNPDFGTVERAVEGIDFSYSERYVPDRRPFFMEAEQFYAESTLVGRFFYSQRVPDFDTGLNLYGKVAPRTSLGLLGAFDVGNRSDYLVRGRQEFNETDSLAFSAIGRDSADGHNQVFVLHPVWRGGNWVCLTHWAPSFENGRYLDDALVLDFSYEGQRLSFGNNFHYVRPEFRADNGYIPFTDLHGNYTWMTHRTEWREGPLRLVRWAGMMREEQHFDGRWFRLQPAVYLWTETRADWGVDLHWEGGKFQEFEDNLFEVRFKGRVSDKFHNYSLGLQFGRQGGEDLLFLTPRVTWRFGERFTVGVASSILSHREDRQQHIVSVNYDLSKDKSVGGRLVQQNGLTSAFVSFRRSGYKGTDYYVIFGDPDPVKKFTPQLMVKVVVPF
ncbi:MAG: carbohydrate binding family 9 domain-containing protein [Verrucomicrobia bacterium]|nr:carbohydrate binding family 9 domain-containing protein [Verrucomicrobiota bacterium]